MLKKTVIKAAIQSFLTAQADKTSVKHYKELEKAENALEKATNDGKADEAKISSLVTALTDAEKSIHAVRKRYEIEQWIQTAAENLTKQVSFGTHISKGIHPSSRGDNIISNVLRDGDIPAHIVGTHSIDIDIMDMTGNAAALPIYDFLEYAVDENHKIKDLILSDNAELIQSLSEDEVAAHTYHTLLKELLLRRVESPVTSTLNKQVLFPINSSDFDNYQNIDSLEYVNIIPLLPSVFCRAIHTKVRDIRGDDNFNAEQTRYHQTDANKQQSYTTIRDLAVLNVGGAKPQNVSKLVQMQFGNLTLLPSLPPVSQNNKGFFFSKRISSLFISNQLDYLTEEAFNNLYAVVNATHNNAATKRKRENAVELIISIIFEVAQELRSREAGWVSDYALNLNEKLWLDPKAVDLEGYDWITSQRTKIGWQDAILTAISLYINNKLKKRFPEIKENFGAVTVSHWRSRAVTIANNYKLKGQEVLS